MAVNTRLPLPNSYQSYLRRVIQDGGIYEQIPTVQFLNQYNKIVAYNPSLVMFPSSEKPGTLYTVTPNTSSADFTVTRASSGSYFDRNGILRTAIANEPRLNWNPITRQFNGVLIEPAATNLLLRSEEVENTGVWARQNIASITANAALSPINTLTADKIIPDTTSNQHRIFQFANFTGPGVLSVYAKADGYNFLSLARDGGVAGGTIIFDLSNGTISGTAGTMVPSIENVGNGWYRCSIYRNDLGGGINLSYWIIVRNNNTTNNYVGDGTSGILVWGAQLEAGANATSYIPTTTTTGSRVADVIGNTNMGTLIGQTEGTIYIDANLQGQSFSDNVSKVLCDINLNNTNQNRITLYRFNNLLYYDNVVDNVVQSPSTPFFTITNFTGKIKIALVYQQNNVKVFINGTLANTDTSALIPTCNNINIGHFRNSLFWNGTINSAALYRTTLTDDQAINLTSL